MPFYKQAEDAEQSLYTRLYREEVDIAFSAIDCVLNGEKAIYASSELTTGARLYQALREYGLKTAKELKQKLGEKWYQANIWEANVKVATDFAAELRLRLAGQIVITPAPFAAPGWTQPEYLEFWETLLRTRIKEVRLNRNWQFSNGCTLEFAVAEDAGLRAIDAGGHDIDLQVGVRLMEDAIRELDADHFDTAKLRENLNYLHHITQRPRGAAVQANPGPSSSQGG